MNPQDPLQQPGVQPGVPPQTPVNPAVDSAVHQMQTPVPAAPGAAPVVGQPMAQPGSVPPASPQMPSMQPTVGGVAPAPQSFSTLSATSKSKKPLLIAVIAVVAAAVLTIGGFFLYKTLMSVSQDDYKKASALADEVRTAYGDINSVYISPSNTETELNNNLDTLKNNQAKFDSKLTELGSQKAVKRDKEINDLYKALTDKKPSYDAAVGVAIEAYEKVFPVIIKMSAIDSTTDSDAGKFLANIRSGFESVSGLTDTGNQQLVAKIVAGLKKAEDAYERVAAGQADFSKYDSRAVSDFYDALDEVTNATRDWQSNLEKMADDGELRDEVGALADKLFEKSLKE